MIVNLFPLLVTQLPNKQGTYINIEYADGAADRSNPRAKEERNQCLRDSADRGLLPGGRAKVHRSRAEPAEGIHPSHDPKTPASPEVAEEVVEGKVLERGEGVASLRFSATAPARVAGETPNSNLQAAGSRGSCRAGFAIVRAARVPNSSYKGR